MMSEYVLKNEAWDGAQASFAKGYEKGKREAADEIDRLTRELAEAREALGKAEAYIPTETVECRGDKCRELWCVSCFGEEEAEREIERAKFLAEEIRALKEKP